MLTTTTPWKQYVLCDGARLRMLVEIYDGTNTWRFVDESMESYSDLAGTEEGVIKVSPVGVQLDPLRRDFQFATIFVDFHDEHLRPIVANYPLKGQRVNIWLGAAELDETDFVNYAVNTQVVRLIPRGGGVISLELTGQLELISKVRIPTTHYLNKHPLECLYLGDGTGVLEKAGGHSFDTDSFDPTDSAYDGLEHLIVSRAWTYIINSAGQRENRDWSGFNWASEETGGSLAQQICRLLNGHLVENEDGDLSFKRFNASASAVDNWTEDDIVGEGDDLQFVQEEIDGNLINRLIVEFGQDPDGKLKEVYQADDTASQSAYAFPSESERIIEESWESLWVGTPMFLEGDITAGATSLVIKGAGTYALSGNRSDAWAAVDADHPIYLMLDSAHIPGVNNIEIVKCTSITRDTTINSYPNAFAGGSTWEGTGPFCGKVTCSSLSRAQLGTSASVHKRSDTTTWVYDITPLVLICDELLARFKNGCPIISLETSIKKFPVQIGDLVTVTTDRYLSYAKDGIDTSTKWEVIGKEADPHTGIIKWILALAATDSLTRTGIGRSAFTAATVDTEASLQQHAVRQAVRSGLGVTQDSGLDGVVASGESTNGTRPVKVLGDVDITFTASKDTYVYLSALPPYGAVMTKEVNNGGADPGGEDDEAFLGKVVTDGSGITSIDSTGVPIEPVLGRRVIGGSLGAYQLTPKAAASRHNWAFADLTRE